MEYNDSPGQKRSGPTEPNSIDWQLVREEVGE